MSKTKTKKDLTNEVMKDIKKEKVRMRPRFYFVLGSLSLGMGLAGSVLFTIFFVQLMFFRLRVHYPFSFLALGRLGFKPFLATFPLLFLLLAIIGIGLGIYLLRRYDLSYKKSFFGIAIALGVFVLTIGFLLDRVGFNKRVGNWKPLRPFYQVPFSNQNWLLGEVDQFDEKEIIVITPAGDEVVVRFDTKTRFPLGRDFSIGKRVRVVGEWQDDVFMAKGISCEGMMRGSKEGLIKGRRSIH